MRHRLLSFIFLLCVATAVGNLLKAEKLVVLHTNDTHSQIVPNDKNEGGAGRRAVLFDSVRAAEKHVIAVDAGDAVQGTLYFNLYGGEVEQKVMNYLDYDLRILGNHEFDNGIDSLAAVLRSAKSQFISTNYDLSQTPLAAKFDRYAIREVGGRRIGFIGINLDPNGMIADGNYDGLNYSNAADAANASAWWLKNVERCDLVVAITHIGCYPSTSPGDYQLGKLSDNIDIIIGGHSHDLLNPASPRENYPARVANRSGKDVLICQAGKAGRAVGMIKIDLESMAVENSILTVDKRLDDRVPAAFNEIIAPYSGGIDSIMRVPVGRSKIEMAQDSPELLNWATDVVYAIGSTMAEGVDFAILNKGGIRRGLPKGTFTEGEIMTMLPFTNFMQVIDIKGTDLLQAFEVMARAGGNGVSKGVKIVYDRGTKETLYADAKIVSASINGEPFDTEKTYRVATIDYVANGGDYMSSLKNHTLVAVSTVKLYDEVLNYLRTGEGRKKQLNPSGELRMVDVNE